VTLDRRSKTAGSARPSPVARNSPFQSGGFDRDSLDIALMNNMPDAALDATERQFRSLLAAVCDDRPVRLTLYTLPEVRRTEFGRQQVSRYASIDELWTRDHDGLIVTGTEPVAADLKDEPYWQSLTKVFDWAERHTFSTILSCLAAHAGTLHMDGIERRPIGQKRFGVFECVRVSDHPLVAATPANVRIPHSRWNEIPEDALAACGYRILTRSNEAGVDAFVKQRGSLFVFLQGHPEYEAITLLLEYRRDVGRYLRGERETYPDMPRGYFDAATIDTLAALQRRALVDRREELLADFPTADAAAKVTNTWRGAGEGLYRNWLRYLWAKRVEYASAAAV
jgi:homoserine O-succinyltransferase